MRIGPTSRAGPDIQNCENVGNESNHLCHGPMLFRSLFLFLFFLFIHYDFLCLFAKLRADSTDRKPHLRNAKALRVGRPFSSFIGPFIPENRAAKLTLRGLVPFFTGALTP